MASDQESIEVDGVAYIRSRDAARKFGYAQDYIGQLARKGQVDARRVGGMWYVSPSSLEDYTKSNPSAAENLGVHTVSEDSIKPAMHSISIQGDNYTSTSKVAEITGYHRDYVGQLARSKIVPSKQIGSRWFVDQTAVSLHKKEKDALLASVQSDSVGFRRPEMLVGDSSHNVPVSRMHEGTHFTYESRNGEVLPAIFPKNQSGAGVVENRPQNIDISDTDIESSDAETANIDHGHTREAFRVGLPLSAFATMVLLVGLGVSSLGVIGYYALTSGKNSALRTGLASVASVSFENMTLIQDILAKKKDYVRAINP